MVSIKRDHDLFINRLLAFAHVVIAFRLKLYPLMEENRELLLDQLLQCPYLVPLVYPTTHSFVTLYQVLPTARELCATSSTILEVTQLPNEG